MEAVVRDFLAHWRCLQSEQPTAQVYCLWVPRLSRTLAHATAHSSAGSVQSTHGAERSSKGDARTFSRERQLGRVVCMRLAVGMWRTSRPCGKLVGQVSTAACTCHSCVRLPASKFPWLFAGMCRPRRKPLRDAATCNGRRTAIWFNSMPEAITLAWVGLGHHIEYLKSLTCSG